MLPKSLHTVSVLVSVARGYYVLGRDRGWSAAIAVDEALHVLGYADAPDPHGLRAVAVRKLEKELQRAAPGALRAVA